MPQIPKNNPARRNRSATRATLSLVHDVEAPELPDTREWHPQTTSWWADIWASPMAPEFDDSDQHGLFALAVLVDDFWMADKPSVRASLSAEIRLQRQCFGLTPIDRRRLQWEIERGQDAEERTQKRKAAAKKATQEARDEAVDPRSLLQAVK
jgi:hypothetical protein